MCQPPSSRRPRPRERAHPHRDLPRSRSPPARSSALAAPTRRWSAASTASSIRAAAQCGDRRLDKAPRNAHGRVEYSADFYILKPVDIAKGNGALLYDVNNRGNKGICPFQQRAGSNDPATAQHAGNGFLMRQGYTLLWNGWIPGLPAANNNAAHRSSDRDRPAGPIVETVWDELLFNETRPNRRA